MRNFVKNSVPFAFKKIKAVIIRVIYSKRSSFVHSAIEVFCKK